MWAAWELVVRWRRPIIALLVLAAVVAGYFWWEGRVEARVAARVNAEWLAKEEKISREAEARYKIKLEAALAKQKALLEEDGRLAAEAAKWEVQHETATQKHITAALSGVERLRIEVRAPADQVPGGAEGPAAGPAGPPEPTETADVVPEVAAAILRIAADSARDVRDYNDLLDRYRLVEKACR